MPKLVAHAQNSDDNIPRSNDIRFGSITVSKSTEEYKDCINVSINTNCGDGFLDTKEYLLTRKDAKKLLDFAVGEK